MASTQMSNVKITKDVDVYGSNGVKLGSVSGSTGQVVSRHDADVVPSRLHYPNPTGPLNMDQRKHTESSRKRERQESSFTNLDIQKLRWGV